VSYNPDLKQWRPALTEAIARNGDVELVFETLGRETGDPLLLVMGTSGSMMLWPAGFLDELTVRGFQITRFDNRDAGLSTHFRAAQSPSTLKVLLQLRRGRNRQAKVPYRLEDMAADCVAVLDAAGWESAHIVGISLGAAIAQLVAADYSERVRTLTSISSAPPDFRIARLSLRGLRLLPLAGKSVRDRDAAAEAAVRFANLIGSPAYPTDDDLIRQAGRTEYDRAHDRGGGRRQGMAIIASGNRLARLCAIKAPTLVIHGEADILAPLKGSRLIAEAIPGARLLTIPGLGHDLPQGLWFDIAQAITDLARPAENVSP
jgi:pimeloyl-ACP methyl ester carboxylesterase